MRVLALSMKVNERDDMNGVYRTGMRGLSGTTKVFCKKFVLQLAMTWLINMFPFARRPASNGWKALPLVLLDHDEPGFTPEYF